MAQIGINDLTVFIPETQAVATEVSANFSVVKAAHNDTDTRVGTLETTVTTNAAKSADKTISNIFDKTQSYKKSTITGATNATPIVITSVAHGRSTGDSVFIEEVAGNTAANGTFTITKVTNDTFSLDDSVGNGTYTSGGVAYLLPKNKEDLINKAYLDNNAGGVNKFSALGTVTTNITLEENKITTAYFSGTNTITLPTVTDTAKQVVCILDFTTATSGQPTITNSNIKWSDLNQGKPPSVYSILSGVRNLLVFKSIWIGEDLYWEVEYRTYGAIETTFVRPSLVSNGALGGASFAVYSDQDQINAYKACDGSTTTEWLFQNSIACYYTIYNPSALKVSSFSIKNPTSDTGRCILGWTVYGSNDNSNFTALNSGTNSITGNGADWNMAVNSTTFYKYYKIFCANRGSLWVGISELGINAVYLSV